MIRRAQTVAMLGNGFAHRPGLLMRDQFVGPSQHGHGDLTTSEDIRKWKPKLRHLWKPGYEPEGVPMPTNYMPGTLEKMAELTRRLSARQELFAEGDACDE